MTGGWRAAAGRAVRPLSAMRLPGRSVCAPWGRRLGTADHPGRRLVRTAGGPPVPSAHRHLFAECRVLPARAVGRAGGGVRVGGRRAGAGLLPAAPEGEDALAVGDAEEEPERPRAASDMQ